MHAVSRPGTITILAISLLHLYQAAMVIAFPGALGATPLLALRDTLRAIAAPSSHLAIGVVLLATATAATIAALVAVGRARMWLFLPQHFLLGAMAVGGIYAAAVGYYLDGTVIPWPHIAADQAPLSALFLAHTVAIIRRCWESR